MAPEHPDAPPLDRSTPWRVDRRPAPPAAEGDLSQRPVLADGVELVGEYEGSGYVEPHHLARRSNGAVVQLSNLLHLVAARCDGEQDLTAIAEGVTADFGRTVSPENVLVLVEKKLRPLGVLADADGTSPEVPPPDPLLGLRLRTTLVGPAAVRVLTRPLGLLFAWPLVAAVAVALVAFDMWLFGVHGLAQGLRATVSQPLVFVVVIGLVVLSAAFHELGHATACAVSGGRPGKMGAGIYVAWPAFYTDVTDAYRLPRAGRLRTDLGGVYFNAVFMLAVAGVYGLTGFEPLLLVCFLLQVQILQQMLPLLRLDGYYVLSDAIGVPDLFKRIGPVLKAALPGREAGPEVTELTPKARRIVTGWVALFVPLLLANLVYLLFAAPRIVATTWDSAMKQVGVITHDSGAALVVAAIQLVILVLPTLGVSITAVRAARSGSSAVRSWAAGSPARVATAVLGGVALLAVLAVAWWPDGRVTPYRENERGTLTQTVGDVRYAGTGSPLLRGPSQATQPLPPVAPGASAADPATASAPAPATTPDAPAPSATPGSGATSTPAASAAPSSAGPTPAVSATPGTSSSSSPSTSTASPTPMASASTAPTPTPTPTPTPSPTG